MRYLAKVELAAKIMSDQERAARFRKSPDILKQICSPSTPDAFRKANNPNDPKFANDGKDSKVFKGAFTSKAITKDVAGGQLVFTPHKQPGSRSFGYFVSFNGNPVGSINNGLGKWSGMISGEYKTLKDITDAIAKHWSEISKHALAMAESIFASCEPRRSNSYLSRVEAKIEWMKTIKDWTKRFISGLVGIILLANTAYGTTIKNPDEVAKSMQDQIGKGGYTVTHEVKSEGKFSHVMFKISKDGASQGWVSFSGPAPDPNAHRIGVDDDRDLIQVVTPGHVDSTVQLALFSAKLAMEKKVYGDDYESLTPMTIKHIQDRIAHEHAAPAKQAAHDTNKISKHAPHDTHQKVTHDKSPDLGKDLKKVGHDLKKTGSDFLTKVGKMIK